MNAIHKIRMLAGLSQQDLARLAGTSQPTIAAYETGRKSPTLQTVERIALAAGFEPSLSLVPAMTREDKRSLAFHQVIAKLLKDNPEPVIQKAKLNLGKLCMLHPDTKSLFDEWNRWLLLPADELGRKILDPDVHAREMRQVSPFSGVLNSEMRNRVIRNFRKQFAL